MSIRFSAYQGPYRIVSLALDAAVKDDLLLKELPTVFIEDGKIRLLPEDIVLSSDPAHCSKLSGFHNYDVLELWENGHLLRKYDDRSGDNYFFITGKCNSNCVMCPSSAASRKNASEANLADLTELARHIPIDTPHLTITGGEPFMIGEKIFPFLVYLKERFPTTEFLLLTNGRVFSIKRYLERFLACTPSRMLVAIPVHGSCPSLHDSITKSENSFRQTERGILGLLKNGVRVELRIVVSALNVHDFTSIARLILRKFRGVEYVSVIAMEMTGNARLNLHRVWIPYRDAFAAIADGVRLLVENGIDVKLYNFPLCTVERGFWPLCEKSISPNKVRYAAVCSVCRYKNDCGGVFAGTLQLEQAELEAIT